MNLLLTLVASLLFVLTPTKASALTVEQFQQICQSTPGECSGNGTLQAYVGGALDLLATLNDQTDYLNKLYCKQPTTLFDVSAIIRFMQAHSQAHDQQNAMLLMVRYFEQRGGCNENR